MSDKSSQKQYAQQMLDQLKTLDHMIHRAFYEMGRILEAFRTHKLWELVGYTSWRQMIEEELSCSYSSAVSYALVYRELVRLKYTKEESIKVIETFGLRTLSKVLPNEKAKLSVTQLRHRRDNLKHCVSFWVDPADEAVIEEVLTQYGMIIKDGRWENSSDALLALVAARKQAA